MGSYGSMGSASPYIQAGSEGAIGASVGGSFDVIKENKNSRRNNKYYDDDDDYGRVYYHNGNKIDTRPNKYYYK